MKYKSVSSAISSMPLNCILNVVQVLTLNTVTHRCIEGTLHLVGPFVAEYWTICALMDVTMLFSVIGHFVPQDSLLLQIPAGTAADRTERRSSDVTVGYITYSETFQLCFQVG
ncbi:hypothetical protein ILYODFUR_028683 [Ilyodon furcidens]|uniref:Uncharacterized protein n=1 Tax=Ilyodon furcidens TaxID=33524 RepID=A0ABV0T4D1_9TELE